MRLSVHVPAKINMVLSVGPRRPDGFHGLATVFHAVSLYDEVSAASAEGGVTLTVDGPYGTGLPADGSNLAVRAAHALAEAAGVPADVALEIHKSIPVAAGLAGGSADAAGTLLACNELWGLGWSPARLSSVAASLGSDVPFALVGGTALGTGRGELLRPLRTGGELCWVLAVVADELSTPSVYRRLDELRVQRPDVLGDVPEVPHVDQSVLSALDEGNAESLAPLLANDLQAAAVDLCPRLRDILRAGRAAGALGGIVSGSGPTCIFLARDLAHSRIVADALTASGTCAAAETATGPVTPARA